MTADDAEPAPAPRTRLAEAVDEGRPVGRSHRLHRPRGGFCGRGYCQQCPLTTGALACETEGGREPARSGHDPLRALGCIGERMEPWFYESRFLRPRIARQPALEVLRRLSAAHVLPGTPAVRGDRAQELVTDVLVVGGGPAGLAAATAAASRTSVVLATRARAGGSLPQDAETRGRVAEDLAAIRAADSQVRERSLCIGRYEGEDRFVLVSALEGPTLVRAERVVIATGAYDRPLLVRGADLPGVIGLRSFQLLVSQGAFRARGFGVVGAPPEIERAVRTAAAFGVAARWIVSPAGGDWGRTPTYAGEPVREILGTRRARGLRLDDGRRLQADVVVVATSQPTYELQLLLGATPRFEGVPPVIRADGPTSMPSIAVGEAAGWRTSGGAGWRAAALVTAWLDGAAIPPGDDAVDDVPLTAHPAPDAVVCVCEDVRQRDVDRAIDDGFGDVELVKRRSGAATGACQGKLCLALIAESFTSRGLPAAITTVRPPIRPVAIASLGGAGT